MCEIGKKFSNVNYYNKEMAKGMEDKLFFIDKLPKDKYMFIDFGCADGTMINALTSVYDPVITKYIGYDISETMIEIAKTNYHGPVKADIMFTSNWKDVKEKFNNDTDYKKVLILSSVIHEVYSYGNDIDISLFWERVGYDWDYVIIRDMCPSEDIDRESDKHHWDFVTRFADQKQLFEFMDVYGNLRSNKNLVHFLLKYRWKVNWDRELHENYFPIYAEELLEKMNNLNFKLDYFERFRVSFLDKCISEDFVINLDDYTHVKAIFTKKK